MKLYDLINRLDSIVPEETQESWDNSGDTDKLQQQRNQKSSCGAGNNL